jgi:hypothetical protein
MTRMTLDVQGKRRLMIGIALVATLVAAWFAPDEESAGGRVDLARSTPAPAGEGGQPSGAPPTAEERRAALAALDVDLIRQRDAGSAGDDAFARKSWYVPPPPPPPTPQVAAPVVEAPPPPPPPPPVAPPLPFKHLGRLVEAGQALPKHYLMDGDRMIVVSEGDLIGGKYRFVGQIGNNLQFIYLPLNQRQNLPMSGAQ